MGPFETVTTEHQQALADPGDCGDVLRWARLCRISAEVGLSEGIRAELWSTLEQLLGEGIDQRAGASVHEVAVVPSSLPPLSVPRPDEADWDQCGLMIRHLVQADASWKVLSPWVRRLVIIRPQADAAANAVELAFLVGTGADIECLVGELLTRRIDYWFHIRPEVRSPLLVGLWREHRTGDIAQIVFDARDDHRLTSVERLFVFYSLQRASDPSLPYLFYTQYEKPIHDAVGRFGEQLGLSPVRFLMAVARIALDAGDHEAARRLAERVPADCADREEALRLLLDIATDRGFQSRERCVEQISEEKDIARRVDMMRGLLTKTRDMGGLRDRNRPAVNHLLSSVGDWLAPRADVWRSWSKVLVDHRDLDGLLPDLFDTFVANALVFHTPELDRAMWDPVCELSAEGSPRERYWRGVAIAHRFVSGGSYDESLLWEARGLIVSASAVSPRPMPHDWAKIHQSLVRAIAKTPRLVEKEREGIQVMLRIAGARADVTIDHVEAYLERYKSPMAPVLEVLEDFARQDHRGRLERSIIDCRTRDRRYSNEELGRLWNIACASQAFDEAWRVASVLHARMALHPALVPAWEISGEKRRDYSFSSVNEADVRGCLHDFAPDMARFCESILVLGPALTELLAVLDARNVVHRPTWPSKSLEKDVAQALDRAAWMSKGRKRHRFGLDIDAPKGHLRPPFMQTLPNNSWSLLLAEICERLGMHAWRWNTPYLASLAEDMIPGIRGKFDVVGRPGKVARWMRSLSPAERSAWNDVQRLARGMDEAPVVDALATLTVRLATVCCQNHFQALTSLHAMRAPMSLVRGLERWIVSPEYMRLRLRLGTRMLVPVPLECRNVIPLAPGSP